MYFLVYKHGTIKTLFLHTNHKLDSILPYKNAFFEESLSHFWLNVLPPGHLRGVWVYSWSSWSSILDFVLQAKLYEYGKTQEMVAFEKVL